MNICERENLAMGEAYQLRHIFTCFVSSLAGSGKELGFCCPAGSKPLFSV